MKYRFAVNFGTESNVTPHPNFSPPPSTKRGKDYGKKRVNFAKKNKKAKLIQSLIFKSEGGGRQKMFVAIFLQLRAI